MQLDRENAEDLHTEPGEPGSRFAYSLYGEPRAQRRFGEPNEWIEFEPFDRAGLTEWTGVFDCDEDGCENRVAVYDPYGTCGLVLCAEHNDGEAVAGPIDFAEPDWDEEIEA